MLMTEQAPASALDQLRWSLQALALPYEAQRNLFPSFACIADELALDFDHWHETAMHHHDFGPDQIAALASVDSLLAEMTAEKDSALWTDDALAHLPRWETVRERARNALEALHWTLGTPPSGRSIFVGPEPGS
jgi:hypothetical protein